MSEVAYGKRRFVNIKIRGAIGFALLILKKHSKRLLYHDQIIVKKIGVSPEIKDLSDLGDILNRVVWGFPKKKDLKIYIKIGKDLRNIDLGKIKVPGSQHNYLKKNSLEHINLVTNLPKNLDAYLLHKVNRLVNPINLWRVPKTFIIDKNFYSYTESRTWRDGYWETLTSAEREKIIELSRNNFLSLKNEVKNFTKAYCFVTGPTFDTYKNFDFERDSIKIICNSVVKNHDFLNYIEKPHVLTFADPVFHFSSNNYSTLFRTQAVECVEKFGSYMIVPLKTVPLLLHYFPDLASRIIGVDWGWKLNFPDEKKLMVKHSGNILTYFMIPFASSLADEVNVMGADGRKPDENYFWKHSKTAQYSDLMNDVFETHPSFFRDRDYADYYEEHCENLERMLAYGESFGKRYFSITPSYIPAFQKRQKFHAD